MQHAVLSLADKLTLLGELEHGRRHCIRSMHSVEDPDEKFYYKVKAKQLQNARRKAEEKWANTDEYNWCLVKVSTKIKQLNEEVFEADDDLFSEIENIADDLLSHTLHEDLTGCSACREDKQEPTNDV